MCTVTSYAEVWIEISVFAVVLRCYYVTSYAEVWIEIYSSFFSSMNISSPPTRRCGLKSFTSPSISKPNAVTSYAEVWIEI